MTTNSKVPVASIPAALPAGGGGFSVFESADAQSINKARLCHLANLNLDIRGKTVLDVGCGVGHLGGFFEERGGSVIGVDARPENIERLHALYPGRQAHALNAESGSLTDLGRFDIVFCYGLLYHLENPIAALRNIATCCKDLLLLETVVSDDARPVLQLVDEPRETKNQAVSGFGCRPSPAFVTMALNRIGFRFVYTTKSIPDHVDFAFDWRNSGEWQRDGHLLRCIFVASRNQLDNPELVLLLPDPEDPKRYLGEERASHADEQAKMTDSIDAIEMAPYFSAARACWNQRDTLAELKPRIVEFARVVDDARSLNLYQHGQLAAAALEFRPDLILELGRGWGNSTCTFTEIANRLGTMRVLSLDQYSNWDRTADRLKQIVRPSWFGPLQALVTNILTFDFRNALAGARRVLLFWDAHGFEIAEVVLGSIMPELAGREHLVIMHDICDLRYQSTESLSYGNNELWTGGNNTSKFVKIGFVDSNVEQAIAIMDFSTRNRFPLHTADHSLATELSDAQAAQLATLWGDMFSQYAQWLYFSLREAAGPLTFPRLPARPRVDSPR